MSHLILKSNRLASYRLLRLCVDLSNKDDRYIRRKRKRTKKNHQIVETEAPGGNGFLVLFPHTNSRTSSFSFFEFYIKEKFKKTFSFCWVSQMLRITFWRSGSCLSSWLPLSVFIFVFFCRPFKVLAWWTSRPSGPCVLSALFTPVYR